MEDVGNLRRRPAAAAEQKPPSSPPRIQTRPAAVFRAAEEEEEEEDVHQVRFKERSEENQKVRKCRLIVIFSGSVDKIDFVRVQLLEDKEPDDGGASGKPEGEKSRCSLSTSQLCGETSGDGPAPLSCSGPGQPAELEVLSAHAASGDEPQPEEEAQRNGPVFDEEEEEAPSRNCALSSDEDHRPSNTSVPTAEASEAGSSSSSSSPPCPPQTAAETSQRVDGDPESFLPAGAEETSPAAPGELGSAADGASPPACGLQLASCQKKMEEEEEEDEAASSAGVGPESGISSLAVSPDVESHGNVFPVNGGEPRTEPASGLSGSSEVGDQLTEVTFSSFQSCTQTFQSRNWTQQQHPAANEDTFGHEIEDGYHSYYDRFAAQIAVSVGEHVRTSVTSVRVVETKEKTSVGAKEEELEADRDRTEISIMEATMDTNEWITEGGAPLLPWMTPAPLGRPKTHQGPSEEPSASEAPPSAEVPPPGTLFADESVEPSKKVVAVQPMPQNVNVTFRVQYHTQSPHQTVAVTGDHPELGSWRGFVPLEEVAEGQWSAVVSLPTESHLEWKFVLLDKGEVSRWEECRNRLLDTGLGDDVLVRTWWGLA